jgi:hypothetical protein
VNLVVPRTATRSTLVKGHAAEKGASKLGVGCHSTAMTGPWLTDPLAHTHRAEPGHGGPPQERLKRQTLLRPPSRASALILAPNHHPGLLLYMSAYDRWGAGAVRGDTLSVQSRVTRAMHGGEVARTISMT